MDPAALLALARRVRWHNVARLAALVALAATVLLWPHLSAPPPALPPAGAIPVTRGPAGPLTVREPVTPRAARAGAAAPATRRPVGGRRRHPRPVPRPGRSRPRPARAGSRRKAIPPRPAAPAPASRVAPGRAPAPARPVPVRAAAPSPAPAPRRREFAPAGGDFGG